MQRQRKQGNDPKTYSKFADFHIVDADDFCFFRGAQAQAGDEIHQEENNAGAEEGVGEAGDAVGELVGELDPVAIKPAALDGGEAVEVGYVVAIWGINAGLCGMKGIRWSGMEWEDRKWENGLGREGTHAAKRPVIRFPTMPPTACSANTSNASSTWR